jgi:hypothetical protein
VRTQYIWRRGAATHLLGLERVIAGLDGHVLLAVDLDAVGDDTLGLALVVERGSDGAHLGGGELDMCERGREQGRRRGPGRRRTEKPGDEAQVVWPVASQMTALSMLPVPTRLQRVRGAGEGMGAAGGTSDQRMLMTRLAV